MVERSNAPATSENALVIERVFDAPREMVWKAWSDPEQMKRWWGPQGFSAPVCNIDFRVGGRFLAAMQSPDFNEGRPIWSTGVYKEILPLQRIVTTDSFADEHGNIIPASDYGMTGDFPMEMLVTVTFEDAGAGKTKLTLRHEGMPSSEQAGATEGWSQSLDKLAQLLASAS